MCAEHYCDMKNNSEILHINFECNKSHIVFALQKDDGSKCPGGCNCACNGLLAECKTITNGFLNPICDEFVSHSAEHVINAIKTNKAANAYEACAVVIGCQ